MSSVLYPPSVKFLTRGCSEIKGRLPVPPPRIGQRNTKESAMRCASKQKGGIEFSSCLPSNIITDILNSRGHFPEQKVSDKFLREHHARSSSDFVELALRLKEKKTDTRCIFQLDRDVSLSHCMFLVV
jgi:hypothetical protein